MSQLFARFSFCCLTVFFAFLGSHLTAQQEHANVESSDEQREIFDHHVHVLSPALIGHWKSLGMPFSRNDSAYADPQEILRTQNLAGAFLVSMAHLYTTDNFVEIDEVKGKEQHWVQRENDYVAECVRKSPENMVGYFSVNPLRDYALEEMDRCLDVDELQGMKIHFPACGVDLTDADHLDKVATVFNWAADNGVPVLVHVFEADVSDPQELANLFWKKLVQPRRSLEIMLAHLGASGGFNETSKAVLSGYHALTTVDPLFATASIHFDLSGAILPTETDGLPATSDARCKALSELIQLIGVKHFRFASDYPVFSTETTIETLTKKLSLEESELNALLNNKARVFQVQRELASIELPEVRKELLKRVALDQKMRHGLNGKGNDREYLAELTKVDTDNREWLAQQVERHGWLGKSKVGSDGSNGAWLLVQHADQDRPFQQKCLELMIEMGAPEVQMKNVAYLFDRVQVGLGKPQKYGTQFGMKDGRLEMMECLEPKSLNERRASVGLGTIEEYQEIMAQAFKDSTRKPNDNNNEDK